jgi:hypothetical protein
MAASVMRPFWQGSRLRACPMRRTLLATLLLLLLVPTGTAVARDRPQDLLIDACRDEKVDGTYSQRTYRRALDQLPADSDQYTGCRDVINRARLAALNARERQRNAGDDGGSSGGGSGGSGSGSSGGSGGGESRSSGERSDDAAQAPQGPTAAEQKAVADATRAGAAPVRIGGELLQPGDVRQVADSSRDLPAPLIVLLAVLAACALAAAGAVALSRVNARRLG